MERRPRCLSWQKRGYNGYMAVTPLRADYCVHRMTPDAPRHPNEWEVVAGGMIQRTYFATQELAFAYCQDHFDRMVESLLTEPMPA